MHRVRLPCGIKAPSSLPPPPARPPCQAKQQLAQLMWLRQSENIVLEGLARLAALGEEVLPRLLEE